MQILRLVPALGVLLHLAGASQVAPAQCPQTKLLAADAHCGGLFGEDVAIEGDVLVVGSPESDAVLLEPGPGAAYVFRRQGGLWLQEQRLSQLDPSGGDRFGEVVAISGNRILVGAFYHSASGTADGAAYVFRWNGTLWVQEQKLVPSDPHVLGHFGISVAIDGNVAAVSALHEQFGGGDESGSVYVFRYNGAVWLQQQKLMASDAEPFDGLGKVSVLGDFIAATGGGAAYLFHWNGSTWVEAQILSPSDGPRPFGSATALADGILIVGADVDDAPLQDSGSAYVFRRSGTSWLEEQKLVPSDPSTFLHFGSSLAILPGTVIVGAFGGNPEAGPGAGAVYVFCDANGEWSQKLRITTSDATQYDNLGWSVDADGTSIVAGAPSDNDACPANQFGASGAAYIFNVSSCLHCIPAISTIGMAVLAVLVVVAGSAMIRRGTSSAVGAPDRKEKDREIQPPPNIEPSDPLRHHGVSF